MKYIFPLFLICSILSSNLYGTDGLFGLEKEVTESFSESSHEENFHKMIHIVDQGFQNYDVSKKEYFELIQDNPQKKIEAIHPVHGIVNRSIFDDFSKEELKVGDRVILPKKQKSLWFPRFTDIGIWDLEEINSENEIKIMEHASKKSWETNSFYKMILIKDLPFLNPRDPDRDISELIKETSFIRDEIRKFSSEKLSQGPIEEEKLNEWLRNEARFKTLVPDIIDFIDYYRGVLKPEELTVFTDKIKDELKKHDGGLTFLWYFNFQKAVFTHLGGINMFVQHIEPIWFPDIISRPTSVDLSISKFNELFTGNFEFSPLGIHKKTFMIADWQRMNPGSFWSHDVQHTFAIHMDSKLRKEDNSKFSKIQTIIKSKIKSIQDKFLQEKLEDIYFIFWHEQPKTMEFLFPGKAHMLRQYFKSEMDLFRGIGRNTRSVEDMNSQEEKNIRKDYKKAFEIFIEIIDGIPSK